jgi:hypothetical protein
LSAVILARGEAGLRGLHVEYLGHDDFGRFVKFLADVAHVSSAPVVRELAKLFGDCLEQLDALRETGFAVHSVVS